MFRDSVQPDRRQATKTRALYWDRTPVAEAPKKKRRRSSRRTAGTAKRLATQNNAQARKLSNSRRSPKTIPEMDRINVNLMGVTGPGSHRESRDRMGWEGKAQAGKGAPVRCGVGPASTRALGRTLTAAKFQESRARHRPDPRNLKPEVSPRNCDAFVASATRYG